MTVTTEGTKEEIFTVTGLDCGMVTQIYTDKMTYKYTQAPQAPQ